MKKILGMGNALTDVLIRMPDDALLKRFELSPGSMRLITSDVAEEIASAARVYPQQIAIGGSASNTVRAASRLGGSCAFVGKIGKDEYGKAFAEQMAVCGIQSHLIASDGMMSGFAMALITPDGERTFATYLGAASQLSDADIEEECFHAADYFHIEGYLVQNYALIEKAVRMAKGKGLVVSLDLASFNVVEEHFDFLEHLVDEYVDIVFANEEEAQAFTGMGPEESADILGALSSVAVVKMGGKGSVIRSGENFIRIPAVPADRVDTTAAGDFYAAGFLYAHSQGCGLEACGQIGSLMGSRIIEKVGADFSAGEWEKLRAEVDLLIKA